MNAYSIALFLHVTGALTLFAGLGIEWTSMRRLRRATTAEEAKQWLGALAPLRRLYPAAMLTILFSGMYMMSLWGMVGWIMVGFGSMILLGAIGGSVTGRRMKTLAPSVVAESGPLSASLRTRLLDRALWISVQTRVGVALGIIFLMTVKPGIAGSLLTIGVALVAGYATAIPAGRREEVRAQAA